MSDRVVSTRPSAFLQQLHTETTGRLYMAALPEGKTTGYEKHIVTRDWDKVDDFAEEWGGRGYGIFACVSTLKDGAHARNKDTVWEMPALFADIDLNGEAADDRTLVIDALNTMEVPPAFILNSGRGVHAYWMMSRPFEFPNDRDLAIETLRAVAVNVGGDKACVDVTRLMRAPGTRNHKTGGIHGR